MNSQELLEYVRRAKDLEIGVYEAQQIQDEALSTPNTRILLRCLRFTNTLPVDAVTGSKARMVRITYMRWNCGRTLSSVSYPR